MNGPYTIKRIKGAGTGKDWTRARQWLKAAGRYNPGFKLAEMKDKCRRNRAALLLVEGPEEIVGACALELATNRVHVTLIGGQRLSEWAIALIVELEAIARQYGKAYITGKGRRGWGRYLKRYGFHERSSGECARYVKPLVRVAPLLHRHGQNIIGGAGAGHPYEGLIRARAARPGTNSR